MTPVIERAFVLGAGLGTRLHPLTKNLPKPLVQVQGRPLVTHGLDHLAAIGVREAIINTHHAHERWKEAFPQNEYRKIKLTFRHEPVLLDTGGGIKNVEDFFANQETFLIYNGDILTSLPLEKGLAHHRKKKNLVTMVLRSTAEPRHVCMNSKGRVTDIRGTLKKDSSPQYLFTGIHIVEPELFRHIPRIEVKSIISIYLDLIRQGLPIGGVVLDEGNWSDIGTLDEYERINRVSA